MASCPPALLSRTESQEEQSQPPKRQQHLSPQTRTHAELAFLLFLTQRAGPLCGVWEAMGLGTISVSLWRGFCIYKAKGRDW